MRKLTKSKLEEIIDNATERGIEHHDLLESIVNRLDDEGYLAPEPEEPKKLTHIEAAAVIGRGGKVVSEGGYVEQPDSDGDIELYRSVIYTEIKKTIEIDTTVWVNVWSDGSATLYNCKEDAEDLGIKEEDDRIAYVPVRIKETVEVE